MRNLLTQDLSVGGQAIKGPLENINNVGELVTRVVSFLIPLAGIILFFVLVMGGYDFLLSQGNPEKIKSGRAKITAGLIGFVILITAYLAVKIIAMIFGLTNNSII